jgi:two-component system sensor histidine kinase SenX3
VEFIFGLAALVGIALIGYFLYLRNPKIGLATLSSHDVELAVLKALPDAWVIINNLNQVESFSGLADELGMVQSKELVHANVQAFATKSIRDRAVAEGIMDIPRSALGTATLSMLIRISPLSDNRYLLIARDVSDVTRVESVRRDFVANVSHELKTPVGALALLSEAAAEAADDPAAVRRFAIKMQAEAHRLTNLVNDLIDLSRLQSDDPLKSAVLVPIDQIVAEAAGDVREVSESKGIKLKFNIADGLKLACVERQLVTAIRNLIVNAVHYSGNDTTVTVSADQSDGVIEIRVTDQGVGIPEADQARIFERFYRIDPARSRATGGTGLGLSIVKHVVTGHGGDVLLHSIEGQGSTFTLRFPVPGFENINSREVVA